MRLSGREQAILCGLYLSRFDEEGLTLPGFRSFNEAYNVLGFSIGAKPASIKNYRDEFDPLFPNARKGWRKRPLRAYCRAVYDKFRRHSINDLHAEIGRITGYSASAAELENESDSFAKRLLTGRAAESYFAKHYHKEPAFAGSTLEDVTQTGCGYDFSLRWANGDRGFAVEVKGMSAACGQIIFTDKEHRVASRMRENYFVYVVRNFADTPFVTVVRDPANADAGLALKKQERTIVQISWSAKL